MAFDPAKYYAALSGATSADVADAPAQSIADQAKAELIRQKSQQDEIANWSLLNANMQHHMLAAKAQGLDPYKSVIPFGSTTVTNVTQAPQPTPAAAQPAPASAPATSSLTKTALTALAAAALGAGGAGVVSALWADKPAVVESAASPQYEWVLEVEREYSGRIGGDGVAAGGVGSTDSAGPPGTIESGAGGP